METIKIKYRSIIKHEQETISDQFEIDATHSFIFSEERYSFRHTSYGLMEIVIKGNEVILSHGKTKLPMIHNERKQIMYDTLYGQIPLDVYLKKLERNTNGVNLIYYLYDHSTILSKCYLVIEKINPMIS